MPFHCGHCTGQHHEAATGRACAAGNVTPCGWLVEVWDEAAYEDGQARVAECGASAVFTARGWYCEAGHEYTTMETRHAEGWEYAEDEQEAAAMTAAGVMPVLV